MPQIWPLEVANVLALAARKGRLPLPKRAQFLDLLNGSPILVDPATAANAFGVILPLADAHGLTSYDAAYLELALRLRIPLATLDADLRTAAAAVGVVLL